MVTIVALHYPQLFGVISQSASHWWEPDGEDSE